MVTSALLFAIACGICLTIQAQASATRTLTVENIALHPGERIIGFDLHADGASFNDIAPMPPGWSLSIDNEPSWRTKATGQILVGAAALGPDGFSLIKFHLRADPPPHQRFVLTGTVVVTSDFEHQRSIKFTAANFHFR